MMTEQGHIMPAVQMEGKQFGSCCTHKSVYICISCNKTDGQFQRVAWEVTDLQMEIQVIII